MFRTILTLSVVTLALGAPQSSLNSRLRDMMTGRIVGGKDTDIQSYPYQASLEYNGRHSCGAIIISPIYVVTAAHCTDGVTAFSLAIRVGSSIAESGGHVVRVSKINQHPSYNSKTIDYDISILQLSTSLPIGQSGVATIALPSSTDSIAPGTSVAVTGWGTTSENSQTISKQLQVVNVDIVSLANCRSAYGSSTITARMLCAGVTGGGKDACSGDSGGPLASGHKLWGIVSWGNGCARSHYPGVYSDIVSLRSFITKITGL